MSDARFEDAETGPLRLIAQDAEGLGVFSALVQDAVFPITEMTYARARRRFALMLNRFRWEDRVEAERTGRPYERVQSLLVFEDVLAVRTTGIDRSDGETVLSLLQITCAPGPDGTGTVTLAAHQRAADDIGSRLGEHLAVVGVGDRVEPGRARSDGRRGCGLGACFRPLATGAAWPRACPSPPRAPQTCSRPGPQRAAVCAAPAHGWARPRWPPARLWCRATRRSSSTPIVTSVPNKSLSTVDATPTTASPSLLSMLEPVCEPLPPMTTSASMPCPTR